MVGRHVSDLDEFDHKILNLVSVNGRMSVTDIASHIGLSKTPCHQRLKRLENEGYILGYFAALNPKKLEKAHIAFVEVKLNDTREAALKRFEEHVCKIPAVEQCHLIAGRFDYLLKIRTRDMAEYRQTLGDYISSLPSVAYTSTNPVMEAVKDTYGMGTSGAVGE